MVGQIIRVAVAIEGKLQDLHAGKARVLAHLDDLGGHEPQVLRNDGELAQLPCQLVEERRARTLAPRASRRRRRAKGHVPVGLEAPEVVDAHNVVHLKAHAHALDPPGVVILGHGVPVVDWVTPVLSCCGELIGRSARDARRTPVLTDLEELRHCPHLDGIARDIDGHVAHDKHSALVRVALQALPLLEEEVLRHQMVLVVVLTLGAQVPRRLPRAAILLWPLVEGLKAELLLDGHELAVAVKPTCVPT